MAGEAMKFFAQEHKENLSKNLASDYQLAVSFQNEPCSEHSPGLVADNEDIARQIFNIHIDEKSGDVLTTAMSDALTRGLSTYRLSHCNTNEVNLRGVQKALSDSSRVPPPPEPRRYIGFIIATVENIRKLIDAADVRPYPPLAGVARSAGVDRETVVSWHRI